MLQGFPRELDNVHDLVTLRGKAIFIHDAGYPLLLVRC